MDRQRVNLIWGAALIVAGLLFLGQNLLYLENLSALFWIVFFSGLSVAFFASYFMSGIDQWGWLFPAGISAALAFIIAMGEAGVSSSAIAAPLFIAIAAPFLVIYLRDPGKHWWALIPTWVMLVLTAILVLTDYVPGEAIGTLFMFSIALPFGVVFVVDRTRWWALIPAGILSVIGIIPLLTLGFDDNAMGAAIMFLFSIPFFAVYMISRRNWWALIPAGVFLTIGVVVMVVSRFPQLDENEGGQVASILFFGWALTFLGLYLLRNLHPTGWAKYPAIGLGLAGIIALAIGAESLNMLFSVLIIGAGVLLLYNSFRRRSVE